MICNVSLVRHLRCSSIAPWGEAVVHASNELVIPPNVRCLTPTITVLPSRARLRFRHLNMAARRGETAAFDIVHVSFFSVIQYPPPQYLAKWFSKMDPLSAEIPPFQYRSLGSMAQVGDWKAVADLKGVGGAGKGPVMEGLVVFFTWRSAYWTKTVR